MVLQVATLTSTELPVDIRVNNVQNGFAISDNLSGSVPRTTDGGTNLCQISGINGSTSSTTVPSMNVDTTNIVTDDDGKFLVSLLFLIVMNL